MAVPKKKTSKTRQRKRRTHYGAKTAKCYQGKAFDNFQARGICSNCGAKVKIHAVCNVCGYYKGKKIFAKLWTPKDQVDTQKVDQEIDQAVDQKTTNTITTELPQDRLESSINKEIPDQDTKLD